MAQQKIFLIVVGRLHILTIKGNLYEDGETQKLGETLKCLPINRENPIDVIIDMSAAEFIGSGVIGAIFSIAGQAKENGSPVKILGLSRRNKELFEITRLINFVELINDFSLSARV